MIKQLATLWLVPRRAQPLLPSFPLTTACCRSTTTGTIAIPTMVGTMHVALWRMCLPWYPEWVLGVDTSFLPLLDLPCHTQIHRHLHDPIFSCGDCDWEGMGMDRYRRSRAQVRGTVMGCSQSCVLVWVKAPRARGVGWRLTFQTA